MPTISRATKFSELNHGGGVPVRVGVIGPRAVPEDGVLPATVYNADAMLVFTIDVLTVESNGTTRTRSLPVRLAKEDIDGFFSPDDLAAAITERLFTAFEFDRTFSDLKITVNDEGLRSAPIEAVALERDTGPVLALLASAPKIIGLTVRGGEALGFAANQPSHLADLKITPRDESAAFYVNLDGALTLGDVADRIEAASVAGGQPRVTVSFVDDRIVLTDRTTPLSSKSVLRVELGMDETGSSTAAVALGISGVGDYTSDTDAFGLATLTGEPLLRGSETDAFYVRPGSQLFADVQVTADAIETAGSLGLLDLQVADGQVRLDVDARVTLQETGGDGKLRLGELSNPDLVAELPKTFDFGGTGLLQIDSAAADVPAAGRTAADGRLYAGQGPASDGQQAVVYLPDRRLPPVPRRVPEPVHHRRGRRLAADGQPAARQSIAGLEHGNSGHPSFGCRRAERDRRPAGGGRASGSRPRRRRSASVAERSGKLPAAVAALGVAASAVGGLV